jgi:hypothetical protein
MNQLSRSRDGSRRSGLGANIFAQPKLTPERELWIRVLMLAISDALIPVDSYSNTGGGKWSPNDRARAVEWFGPIGSPRRDFVVVCNLAGIDPAAAHHRIIAMIEMPDERRLMVARTMFYEPPRRTRKQRKTETAED